MEELLFNSVEEFDLKMPRLVREINEAARKIAMEFLEWASTEGWQEYDGCGTWICQSKGNIVRSTSQLYEMFKLPF